MPRDRIRTVALAVGLVLVLSSLGSRLSAMRVPGNNQGYTPVQPIAYSHRLHAGELGIDCAYCHYAATQGRHAAIPPAGVCMNCHKAVSAPRADVLAEAERAKAAGDKPRPVISPELHKLYRALGLNDQRERDPTIEPTPIEWVRVHKVPDFVAFDHRSHVAAEVECQECHGPVETMSRLWLSPDTRYNSSSAFLPAQKLEMGWCVDCHDQKNDQKLEATQDCVACHH